MKRERRVVKESASRVERVDFDRNVLVLHEVTRVPKILNPACTNLTTTTNGHDVIIINNCSMYVSYLPEQLRNQLKYKDL